MLDLLNKKNNSGYVTKSELNSLIEKVSQMKKLVGPRGKDAIVTREMMKNIAELAKPEKSELLKLIKPLIPKPKDGENGKDGRDGTELTPEELMNKLKSIRGDGRLLIDDIRGGKKMMGKIVELEDATQRLNYNFGYLNEHVDELCLFRDKMEGFEIAINNRGINSIIAGSNISIDNSDPKNPVISATGGGGSGGYNRVQDNGTDKTQRSILNFDDFFIISDDAVNSRTNVDIDITALGNDSTFLTELENNLNITGNTLDQAYDEGGAGAGRSITADNGAVEITVPDTSNNAGLVINQNDSTNNPSCIEINNVGTETEFYIRNSSGNSFGPRFEFFTNSASPAANDRVGEFTFRGRDDMGGSVIYGQQRVFINDPTAGAENAKIGYSVMVNGSLLSRLEIGEVNGIVVGDTTLANPGIIQSNGNNDLILQTGNASTSSLTITDGVNGDITADLNNNGHFNITSPSGSNEQLFVESVNDGPGGAYIATMHESASPALGDIASQMVMRGKTDTGNTIGYGTFQTRVIDPTNNAEYSHMRFFVQRNGNSDILLEIGSESNNALNGISIGNDTEDAVLSSRGNNNLILQTGNATTGLITLEDGANGNINIAPNGTGQAQYNGVEIATVNDTIQTTKVTLSSAQILALNTTPQELVPAPGAGKTIQIVGVVGRLNFGTTAYDTNIVLNVYSAGGKVNWYTNSDILAETANIIEDFNKSGGDSEIIENSPINITVNAGDPANGDGTLDIYVMYKVIDL